MFFIEEIDALPRGAEVLVPGWASPPGADLSYGQVDGILIWMVFFKGGNHSSMGIFYDILWYSEDIEYHWFKYIMIWYSMIFYDILWYSMIFWYLSLSMEYNYGIIPNVSWDIHDWNCTPNDFWDQSKGPGMVGWPLITMDHAFIVV